MKINLKIALQGAVFMNVMNLSTYAYSGEKKITLTKSDMWVSTDSISAKEIAYNGSVYKSSEKNVWFISEYKNATGWHYDTKILVSPGVNVRHVIQHCIRVIQN